MTQVWFCCVVCGVLTQGQLLPSPSPQQQNTCSLVGSVLLYNVTKPKAVAEPTYVQSTIATRYGVF